MRVDIPARYTTANSNGKQRHCRTQVRLPRNEEQRHGGERAANEQICACHRSAPAFGVELGEHQGNGRLRKLGRLEVERSEIDPPPRSTTHIAEEEDVEEKRDDAEIDEMRPVGKRPVVDAQADEKGSHPEQNGVDLGDVNLGRASGCTVDLRQADHTEG